MKLLLSILSIFSILMVLSCGPSRYSMAIEMRQPSNFGYDLTGKSVSVVYLQGGDDFSSEFSKSIADSFAASIEGDYQLPVGGISVYSMRNDKIDDNRFSFKEMVSLLVETNSDFLVVMDTLRFGASRFGVATPYKSSDPDSLYKKTVQMNMSMDYYVLDGMDETEVVQKRHLNKFLETFAVASSLEEEPHFDQYKRNFLPLAQPYSEHIANVFKSNWKMESISIMSYSSEEWVKAATFFYEYKWKEAIEVWMGFLSSSNPLKRSCAEFNIAVSCYMSGDYKLAKDWLLQSDNENKLTLSDGLHKRIDAHL